MTYHQYSDNSYCDFVKFYNHNEFEPRCALGNSQYRLPLDKNILDAYLSIYIYLSHTYLHTYLSMERERERERERAFQNNHLLQQI